MSHKLAIDFGTTNSVIARWNDNAEAAEIVMLPDISAPALNGQTSTIPSLLYIHNGQTGQATVGQMVCENGLDQQRDNRLIRNFKRGLVASPAPPPRRIDHTPWTNQDAGRVFLRSLVEAMPYQTTEIDQLVLTTPVVAFENYLVWLNDTLNDLAGENIRVVDESTAAALGYAVTEPGAVVLVFDFGGGTLDLSLVQLPQSRAQTGGFLHRLLKAGGKASQHAGQVMAKAGQVIGGSDIDQWLLADVLAQIDISPQELGNDYAGLLTRCEQAKIALSSVEATELTFEIGENSHTLILTRARLEELLEKNGFFVGLRRAIDKVMYVARQRGIYREEINYVLMVGGTSLMPAVQHLLKGYFSEVAVRSDKPFTAIAEGALQLTQGFGLDDYLMHSYGLRHLDPETGRHLYDELIPMGSAYPSKKPVEIILGAAHPDQPAVEFIIGEIDTEAVTMVEVQYENEQAVFVAQAGQNVHQVVPLNEMDAGQTLANLVPPGSPGQDRLLAQFTLDAQRRLRLTVQDLQTEQIVLCDVEVARLR